ncbi:MAG: Rpn family recombination-promoting nuclease/putative transposase [Tannerellaceae bacterium]|jgi:predicted transposase/invertase (TIGR01784 family)|nr:Rpn family recombination-promoting nuclease/putative transposase [Tannerellaceae bacterium]
MTRYLDPKNDLVFKRIFGEHPDLLISFLNALIPLDKGMQIKSVEYLPAELVPDTPLKKYSIVDVRCIDNYGRQFIVEMQMHWTVDFNYRMIFNASKAYVRQLDRRDEYGTLQTVYCLGILNDVFDHKTEESYHHFQIINRRNSDEILSGMEFVLVELPKFKPERWTERRMAALWLRFLKELKDPDREVVEELLKDETIHRALDICEEAAFTSNELAAYDAYWDIIRTEKTLINASRREGHAEGRSEGLVEGLEKGAWKKTVQVVLNSHKAGVPPEAIAAIAELSLEEVNRIIRGDSLAQ